MDADIADIAGKLGNIVEAALGMLQGLFWILIIASGFIFNRRKQKQAASKPAPSPGQASSGNYRERAPIDPANQPGFGTRSPGAEPVPSPYSANPPRIGTDIQTELDRRMNRSGSGNPTNPTADDPLAFGSLFDQQDEQPRGRRQEKTRWGFDESEWGSSFGPKKSSEPTITQG